MLTYRTLDDLQVEGQRVLVRADLNVPMNGGVVSDVTRLERLMPTLDELSGRGARVIVISHFGRPNGKAVAEFSLDPVSKALAAVLNKDVFFVTDCIGSAAKTLINNMSPGDIAVLENVRFHPGEEANDPAFARQLADLGDLYVNDAFSVAHRAHASVECLARLLPNAAGRQMASELNALECALGSPKRPVTALIGGAKVSTKLAVLGHLVEKVDTIIIGGGMANTFLHAKGIEVGASLHEPGLADIARDIMAKASLVQCEIMLPIDAIVAKDLRAGADVSHCKIDSVSPNEMILDIGHSSIAALEARLIESSTVVWNGPLGAFEVEPFNMGTNRVAIAAANLTVSGKLISVGGGGDTVAALNGAKVADKFSYLSTAGGAFLEWLEGKTLPGIEALS